MSSISTRSWPGRRLAAIVILGVDRTEDAVEILHKNWVKTFGDEIYSL